MRSEGESINYENDVHVSVCIAGSHVYLCSLQNSHYGSSTTILHNVVKDGFCVGVDIGEKIIAAAKKRYPDVQFEVADAWDTLQLLKLKPPGTSLGYDVVYADIGGLSGAHGLLESLALMDAIGRALEPRVIVIKSLCMKRLATQLIPCSSVKRKSPQNA